MNNTERVIDVEYDLYEEILTNESLDQYEGLLNHYKNNKKDLKRTFEKKNLLVSLCYLQLKQEIPLCKR